MSSNSIKQHRVPAWPAGHPMEFQHGLLVVQESITLISVFLLVLAAFGNVGSYIAKTPPEHTFLLHCASGGQTINTAAPDI